MRLIRNIMLVSFMAFTQVFAQAYKLVWSDEFEGTTLDSSKWNFESGNNNGNNNESEFYTSRPQNCSVSNGLLTITALKENYSGFNYTSARINTQNKFSFEYGKVEAMIKLPYGKGMWPAFWMLGDNINSVGWPTCGESDIMEMIGGTGKGGFNSILSDGTVYGTLHWSQNGNAQSGGKYSLSSGKFADDFHVFGVTWTPQAIQFYVDSTVYDHIDISPTYMSAFENKFFIILNLAVGGDWPGYPDSTTVFPQMMQVDYVRVYQDTTTVNVVPEKSKSPEGFFLKQNFPNPFNPTTEINYQLSSMSKVTLKVYDLLGREVKTLVEGRQYAGDHTATFDAGELPSGVYFYELASNNVSQVKKMILIK
ncbi:MAG: family 16 glycosylhydrolase [Candidatus Kryptoniota bacterium]